MSLYQPSSTTGPPDCPLGRGREGEGGREGGRAGREREWCASATASVAPAGNAWRAARGTTPWQERLCCRHPRQLPSSPACLSRMHCAGARRRCACGRRQCAPPCCRKATAACGEGGVLAGDGGVLATASRRRAPAPGLLQRASGGAQRGGPPGPLGPGPGRHGAAHGGSLALATRSVRGKFTRPTARSGDFVRSKCSKLSGQKRKNSEGAVSWEESVNSALSLQFACPLCA